MPKVKDKNILDTAEVFIEDLDDLASFEKYCGSCDNFETSECPFLGQVLPDTNRKIEVKCDKYFN